MRILVIEDEPRILAFLARGLEAEGFLVDAATDGVAGVAQASQRRYDLVVLDLLLPKVDGLSVLRALQVEHPGLPVVIVSARSDLDTKLRGFGLGACDYVSKPFSFDELLARVRAQLRRNEPSENGAVMQAGGLSLDLPRRQATLGDVVADLSDREFRLLHHLVQHEGEIVSRESLLAEVWGYHFDPRSNVVEVCVRRLRRKLGAGAPIETVRHGGYRLAAG
ncbi:MAG: response regulator transcription factor [Actinobacteria bacterium]|nr:MAG: response regulator transcription factor [Actinomycetota bacterium]